LQYAGVAESSIEISYCEPKQLKPWAIEGFQGTAQFESVDVTWRTPDLETRSKVLWGLQGTELKNELTNDALKTQHAFSVTGLNSDTTYFFQAIGTDSAGRVKRSDIISVRTLVPNSTSTQTETFTATETVTMTATSTSTVTQTGTTTQTATTTQTETTTQTATTTQTETTTQTATTTQTETTTQTATGTETNTATGTQTATQTETQTETQTATNTSTNTGTEPPPNTTWIVQGFDGTTTGSSATLIWQTVGVNTTAEVFMGTSLSNLAPAANVQDPSETHLILVGGLTPSTTYFFQVRARDAHGRIVDSSIISKRTKAQ
jgi:hypothetical protein